jgi:DNA-binding NtrC family response regulator
VAYRRNHIGDQLAQDKFPDVHAELLRTLKRTHGNLRRSAFQLDVSRRHLYRLINYANLWGEVEKARQAPRQDLLSRTLREL